MKVYLLWKLDPHDDETTVMDVYSTYKVGKEARLEAIKDNAHIKDTAGEAWFTFIVDEMEVKEVFEK